MYLVGLYGYIPFHPSVNSILIFYPTTTFRPKKKIILFLEMRVTRKNFTRAAAKKKFFMDFPKIFYIVSFVFFVFMLLSFFLPVYLFFEIKIILIHIRLCGQVSDKKIFHQADFRKDYFFLALSFLNVPYSPFHKNETLES